MAALAGTAGCLFLFDIVGQLIAQYINLDFQLDLIEQQDLIGQLFTAGGELLDLLMAQQFFEDLDASVSSLDGVFFGGELLLKAADSAPISAVDKPLRSGVLRALSGVDFMAEL